MNLIKNYWRYSTFTEMHSTLPARDSNQQMTASIVSNYRDFQSLKRDWDRVLQKDPDAQLFLSWRWLDRIFKTKKSGWCVVAVKHDDGDYVAFFPLRIDTRLDKEKTAFCDELSMAGSYFWADYTGFVCDPQFDDQAIPLLARTLKQMHWNRLFLKHWHCSEARRKLFISAFSEEIFYVEQREHRNEPDGVNKLICPFVSLPASFDEYLTQNHSSNSRQKIRRFLRKVDEHDELRIRITDATTIERDLDILCGFWRQKWSESKGRRQTEKLADKYKYILHEAFSSDLLFMPVLWRNDQPLGVLAHLLDRERKQLLFYVAGREDTGNNPPTGKVLHAYSLRWAIANNLQRYDFLRGDEPYKYDFAVEENRIAFTVVGTRDGKNLNGQLSAASVKKVMRLCQKYEDSQRSELAKIGYRQILDAIPGHSDATERLKLLSVSNSATSTTTTTDNASSFERTAARIRRHRADDLKQRLIDAAKEGVVPGIPVSEFERDNGMMLSDTVDLGHKLFTRYGVLLIEDAFDVEHINACNKQYQTEYANYFGQARPDDCLSIGHQRFQVTVELKGHFNKPAIYANPIVLALIKSLLGKRHVLGCTVCATSLPGSRDQHLHKDHRALFTADADDPPIETPPFAITTMVPLVSLDEAIGTTLVKKSSHLLSRRDSKDLPAQLPIVPVGSCFLMDLRLSHQGLGNTTDQVRPIMNMVYQQRWFADNKNFSKQSPLRVSDKEFDKIPEHLRYLFAWAVQPGPDITRQKLTIPR